ncbi:hypothetical protein [Ornithinimicrobium kibberense]|uniref:hypothetical protein n=1 Tax=Ornithinimicrobium kibberense TaxID=282060 RepID=UPI0036156BFB
MVPEHRAVGDHGRARASGVVLQGGQPDLGPLPQRHRLGLGPRSGSLPLGAALRRRHEPASCDVRLRDVQGGLGVGDGLEDPQRVGPALVVHPDPVATPEPNDAGRQPGSGVLRAHVVSLQIRRGCVSPVSVLCQFGWSSEATPDHPCPDARNPQIPALMRNSGG